MILGKMVELDDVQGKVIQNMEMWQKIQGSTHSFTFVVATEWTVDKIAFPKVSSERAPYCLGRWEVVLIW